MADGIVRLTVFHRLQNVRIGVIFHILALQIIGSGNDGADHQRHPLSRQSACAVHGIPAVDPQLIRAHGDGPQCALHVGEDLQAQQHIRLMVFQPSPAFHPGAGLKDHVPFQPVGRLCNDLDVQPGQLPILIEIGIGAEIIVCSHPQRGRIRIHGHDLHRRLIREYPHLNRRKPRRNQQRKHRQHHDHTTPKPPPRAFHRSFTPSYLLKKSIPNSEPRCNRKIKSGVIFLPATQTMHTISCCRKRK